MRQTAPAARAARIALVLVLFTIAALLAATRLSPYVTVSPGPTPNLGAALIAAQTGQGDVNPALAYDGPLLATTVETGDVTWGRLAACRLWPGASCPDMTRGAPLAASVVDPTGEYMRESQAAAASAARALVPAGKRGHPRALLVAPMPGVTGASAGLMLTLTFVDALSFGELAPAGPVAGTATVDSDGDTGPVEGVPWKVVGAARAGARVFFVDVADAHAARAAAPTSMTVVPVASARQAVAWLCAHGATSSACALTGPAVN